MAQDPKGFNVLPLYFSLYDVLGYLIPGLVFLCCGYYCCFSSSGGPHEIYTILNGYGGHLETAYAIGLILIWGYLLGHVISWLSKIPERYCALAIKKQGLHNTGALCLLQRIIKPFTWDSIGFYLFRGNSEAFFQTKNPVSAELRERFSERYNRVFQVTKVETVDGTPTKWETLNARICNDNPTLKYGDLLWDAAEYLKSHRPSNYAGAYGFLAQSGLFRSLAAGWFLLTIGLLILKLFGIASGPSWWLLLLGAFFTFASFARYLKFERMFLYTIIRAFAIGDDLNEEPVARDKTVTKTRNTSNR